MIAGELSDLVKPWLVLISQFGYFDTHWYIGTSTESEPIPNPLTRRPMANCTQVLLEDISMTVPMQQKNADTEIDSLRPRVSAILPAIRAPQRHPAQSKAVIVPWRTAEKVYEPSDWSSPKRRA